MRLIDHFLRQLEESQNQSISYNQSTLHLIYLPSTQVNSVNFFLQEMVYELLKKTQDNLKKAVREQPVNARTCLKELDEHIESGKEGLINLTKERYNHQVAQWWGEQWEQTDDIKQSLDDNCEWLNGYYQICRHMLEQGLASKDTAEAELMLLPFWKAPIRRRLARYQKENELIVEQLEEKKMEVEELQKASYDQLKTQSLVALAAQGDIETIKQNWQRLKVELNSQLYGVYPINVACQEGHLQVARWLYQQGAQLDKPDIAGHTANHYLNQLAGQGQQPHEIVKMDPLCTLVARGDLETIKANWANLTHELNAKLGGTYPINLACQLDKVELARWLYQQGAKLNQKDGLGRCATDYLAEHGHSKSLITSGECWYGLLNILNSIFNWSAKDKKPFIYERDYRFPGADTVKFESLVDKDRPVVRTSPPVYTAKKPSEDVLFNRPHRNLSRRPPEVYKQFIFPESELTAPSKS